MFHLTIGKMETGVLDIATSPTPPHQFLHYIGADQLILLGGGGGGGAFLTWSYISFRVRIFILDCKGPEYFSQGKRIALPPPEYQMVDL